VHDPFRDQPGCEHDQQRIGDLAPERTSVFVGDLSLRPGEQKRRIDEDRHPGKKLIAERIDAVRQDRDQIFGFGWLGGHSTVRGNQCFQLSDKGLALLVVLQCLNQLLELSNRRISRSRGRRCCRCECWPEGDQQQRGNQSCSEHPQSERRRRHARFAIECTFGGAAEVSAKRGSEQKMSNAVHYIHYPPNWMVRRNKIHMPL
jgi:hypothetical protein